MLWWNVLRGWLCLLYVKMIMVSSIEQWSNSNVLVCSQRNGSIWRCNLTAGKLPHVRTMKNKQNTEIRGTVIGLLGLLVFSSASLHAGRDCKRKHKTSWKRVLAIFFFSHERAIILACRSRRSRGVNGCIMFRWGCFLCFQNKSCLDGTPVM